MLKIPAMINIMVSQEMARLLARLASFRSFNRRNTGPSPKRVAAMATPTPAG